MKSPCLKVCKLDPNFNICLGCFRTLDEVAAWPSMTEAEQIETLKRCQQRAQQRQQVKQTLQILQLT